jgi:ATP/maltotriose-dependent transcriptional regulator MalT
MSRLSEAQERLENALARLEQVSGEHDAGENSAALSAEFEVVRARCDALEDKARIVSERLDAAIGRVRMLMES